MQIQFESSRIFEEKREKKTTLKTPQRLNFAEK